MPSRPVRKWWQNPPVPVLPVGPEIPLLGGDVTEGVVRIGETVRRPPGPHSPIVRTVLTHLATVGFSGAPRWLGTDDKGRDAFSFIEGEVAIRPWPEWVADESRIASVARLVRAYDDAVLPLGLPAFQREPEPPGLPDSIADPPTLLGHMDITPENVVFRDGKAVALIDFDFVRPATRVEEVCNMLLWWAPFKPVTDRQEAMRHVDPVRRARLLVDAYGLHPADRTRIVEVARSIADRSWHLMRYRAQRLGGGWARMWDDGVGDQIKRRQQWLADQQLVLQAAMTAPASEQR